MLEFEIAQIQLGLWRGYQPGLYLSMTNIPAYIFESVSDEEKKFYNVDTRGECYKKLVCDLRIFVLS